VNADTGESLLRYHASSVEPTGSVLKVFTASAAVLALGADYQITTSVIQGSQAGSIVLVGHGDPTLSAMPPGTESVYTGAPKLSTLAAATLAKFSQDNPGQQITSLILDASYWNPSDKWDSTWKRSEQTIGYHSEVTALQVDGDRAGAERPSRIQSAGEAAEAHRRAYPHRRQGPLAGPHLTPPAMSLDQLGEHQRNCEAGNGIQLAVLVAQ